MADPGLRNGDADREKYEQSEVMPRKVYGTYLENINVGKKYERQRRREHRGVHDPGAAEEKCHLHYGPRLQQHEARPQKKHAPVERHLALGQKQVDHSDPKKTEYDHRSDRKVGDQSAAQIKKRPVVARRQYRISPMD